MQKMSHLPANGGSWSGLLTVDRLACKLAISAEHLLHILVSYMRACLSAGETTTVRCTLRYAPPEVINAHDEGEAVTVQPAHDIWALGVMAYEVIANERAFQSSKSIFACAEGSEVYPWEAARLAAAPQTWRKSRLRPAVQACLERDLAQRPSAAAVISRLNALCSSSSI